MFKSSKINKRKKNVSKNSKFLRSKKFLEGAKKMTKKIKRKIKSVLFFPPTKSHVRPK